MKNNQLFNILKVVATVATVFSLSNSAIAQQLNISTSVNSNGSSTATSSIPKPITYANTTRPTPVGYQMVPDSLNYQKFNEKRDCSPAELLAGKSECYKCDPDVPNVVKPYDARLAPEMAKNGGTFIYSLKNYQDHTTNSILSNGYMGKYNNAFNFIKYSGAKPTNVNTVPKPPTTCSSSGGFWGDGGARALNHNKNCEVEPTYILYKGYNLQGVHPEFSPLNNRSVCEVIKPKQTPNEKDGYGGAGVLGLAGLAVGFGNIDFGDPKAENWKKLPMFNPKGSFGQQNNTASALGKAGGSVGFTATEIFACLEYYTGTNASLIGGDHVLGNPTKSHYCQQPLQTFYNTKVNEIYCYGSPCDGQPDGAFKPATIPMRQMLLMTNPFIGIGQTLPESLRIAAQRPMSMTGF